MTNFQKSLSVSSSENVLVFYNKYFALENDERLLLSLIQDLAQVFMNKIPYNKELEILRGEEHLLNLRYNSFDLASFSAFAKDCIKFFDQANIQINEKDYMTINRYGIITNGSNIELVWLGANVYSYLQEKGNQKAIKDFQNVILQNTLTSKIYQAVRDYIMEYFGNNYSKIFSYVNEDIISYEENLNLSISDILINNLPFDHIRSRR